MKKKLLVLLLLIITVLCAKAQVNTDSIKATIQRLSNGFQNSDIELINKELSPKFSLGAASYPGTRNYLLPILNQKGIRSINFVSIDKVNEGLILVNASLVQSNGKTRDGIIAFDANYKIVFADIIDKLFGASRYNKSELIASIPIEVTDDAIILFVKINDSQENFRLLFDTGADGCALKERAADKLSTIEYESHKTSVVGGQIEVKKSSGNTFHLSENISLKNQGFIVINNDSISTTDGIIGLGIAKSYITEIDFDKKLMNLYSFGDFKAPENFSSLSIEIPSGVMLIDGDLNIVGKKNAPGRFVFDTGANYHLIAFESYVRKNRLLLSGFKPESKGVTISLGLSSPTFSGKAHSFTFADKYTFENMPVTLQASTGRKNVTSMSGSIGFKMLNEFNFIIDMLTKHVYLSPNNKYREEKGL